MNSNILKLAIDAGLLNYIDNETPRRYFICGHAEVEDVEKFSELIVREVLLVQEKLISEGHNAWHLNIPTKEHFGVK